MTIKTSRESLQRLAETIDDDLGVVTNNEQGSEIVRVVNNGEIAIRSLDGMHPFDALLGFVAPEDWAVFGVISYGQGARGTIEGGLGEKKRIRVIHLSDRAGVQASVLRFAYDEQPLPMDTNDPAPAGRVADCILRALNLPTDPPDVGSVDGWEEVRWAVATGERHAPHMDGAVAAWMDAGMFARHTLTEVHTFKAGQLLALLGSDFMLNIIEELDKP